MRQLRHLHKNGSGANIIEPSSLTRFLPRRRQKLIIGILLAISVAIIAYPSSALMAGNSDAMVDTYNFSLPFHKNDVILPAQHDNILKIPLFFTQSLFAYNYLSFTFVNLGLVAITFILWWLLLCKIFGNRYSLLCAVLLVLVAVASREFNNQIVYTTIRNIEYPLAFGYLLCLLKKLSGNCANRAPIFVFSFFAALVAAGDNLMLYILVISSFAPVIFYIIQKRRLNKTALHVGGLALGVIVGGLIVRWLMSVLGLFIGDKTYLSGTHITKIDDLLPSVHVAATQLLDLLGFQSFGANIVFRAPLIITMFVFCLMGILGLSLALFIYIKNSLKGISSDFTESAIGVAGLICLAIFAIYVFSGTVVIRAASGHITSLNNDRYITFIPFLLAAGCSWLLYKLNEHQRNIAIYACFVIIIVSAPMFLQQTHTLLRIANVNKRSYQGVAQLISSHHIPVTVGGYWYGASVRFWSNNHTTYAVVADCNRPSPLNTRRSFYTPNTSIHLSALVIDTSGPDTPFLGYCTEQDLLKIYGKPSYIMQAPSIITKGYDDVKNNPAKSVNIWVYNYDLRTKLVPVSNVLNH